MCLSKAFPALPSWQGLALSHFPTAQHPGPPGPFHTPASAGTRDLSQAKPHSRVRTRSWVYLRLSTFRGS